MYVLILPSWYFKKDSDEITGRMFHQYAHSLIKSGIDASIVYGELNPKSPLKKSIQYNVEDNVPTWRINQFFIPKANSLIALMWAHRYAKIVLDVMEQRKKPDLIHAQSYLTGMVAAIVKKKTGIPFVITERLSDFIEDRIPSRYKRRIRKSFPQADRITCVSEGMKKHLQQYTSGSIEIIPNYFDPEIFYYDPHVKKNEKFTWVSVGEPSRTKGLDVLLHAFGKLKNTIPSMNMQLILVDRIKEKSELMKIVNQYKMADSVIWKGLIPQNAIATILRESHALISASRVESFGKVIIEAQACGLPVIATQTDGATYIVTSENQGLLTKTNDVDALLNSMHELLKKYDFYNHSTISESIGHRFKENVVMGKWKKLYTEITG